MKNSFKDSVVLITGGTGTIGQALTRGILACEPRVVRIFSRDESKQYDMQKEHRGDRRLRFFIGDVRDKERLLHAMDSVDYVFHTAAMKHVIACEYNPFEALKTNLIGTKNVIESSLECGVKKAILTSTDKATNPCNTMGVSKLFAERLFTAANYYKGKSRTVFASVRFGNILGSRGSVFPVFRTQIEKGGPITLTDPAMTRFVQTREDALKFIFHATSLARGGEIFISKMPVVRMSDFTDIMLELFATEEMRRTIKTEIIGAQPGEKFYEEIMTDEEATRAVELDDMFILKPQVPDLFETEFKYPGQRKPSVSKYTSDDDVPISKDELRNLLQGVAESFRQI